MANKLPWFTHDHDAHEDIALRLAVRKHGHVAGWVWWVTLELMHKHGSKGVLVMPLMDMAASMMVDKRTCKAVYETLVEGSLIQRASYEQGPCTVCTVEINNFHQRQSKLKIKIPPTLRQSSGNTPSTLPKKEKEKEKEIYTSGFEKFWDLYPNKKKRDKAKKIWMKLKPDAVLVETILLAVNAFVQTHEWQKDDGKWIPLPNNWIEDKRWEDEVTKVVKDPDMYDTPSR